MHDPLALAIAIDPSLARLQTTRVEVETDGTWTRGTTVTDLRGIRRSPWPTGWMPEDNARVALDVDAPAFMTRFAERLRALVEAAHEAEGGPIVAVLGAINVDLVVSGAPLPGPGETVTGGTFAQHHGGKGGNQAVAAARAIRRGAMLSLANRPRAGVWMLGAVGDDQLGVSALEALGENGVQTDHVVVSPGAPTGVALIAVGPDGREPDLRSRPARTAPSGRTMSWRPSRRSGRTCCWRASRCPSGPSAPPCEWGRDHDVTIVLNPAPPRPWAKDLVALLDLRHAERARARGARSDPPGRRRHRDARRRRRGDPPPRRTQEQVAAPPVPVVDTTGAGDCFNGVLVAGLAWETELSDAVRDAVVAASLSVGTAGAREGMPDAARQIADGARAGSALGRERRAERFDERPSVRRPPDPSPGCSSRSRRR